MTPTSLSTRSESISLADEERVNDVVLGAVLGLWDVVNNLTRLRPSRRDRYRVTIFGSARAAPGSFGYEETRRAAANPIGYLIFTPEGRMMAVLEGEGRKSPQNDQDRLELFRTIVAYTGMYSVDGDKWTTKVDVAWHPDRRGTDQVRSFKLEGDRLYVTSPFRPNPNLGGKVARSLLVLERAR